MFGDRENHLSNLRRHRKVVFSGLPNRRLNTLPAHMSHEFRLHHAKADAEAVGRVLLAMMNYANASTPLELLQKRALVARRFCN
jgi:hypothetical protein